MRNAAMILGLVGGITGMLVGFFGYGFAEAWSWIAERAQEVEVRTGVALGEPVGRPEEPPITRALALASPILGLTGGALAPGAAGVAAALMAASSAGMVYAFGFGVFTMFPVALCAVGAALALGGALAGPPPAPRA